jgi:DNA mismatch repair protein MutL
VPRIAILPGAVADQIAAGEVVERPASVVKELVENALDAGATAVDIVVEDGGRALVRVSDDGSGMDRDDAVLALARHATSKISSAAELVGIGSFGFRGEAIPAICSVSQLEIQTSPVDGAGTHVRAAGGELLDVADAARRRGTTVSVARLFYNTPARQKFLRSARSEWRGISEAVTTIALSRRDVRFTVAHDGKQVLSLAAAPSLRARVAAVWGTRYAETLVEVDDVNGPVHTSGLVQRPADVGTATRRVFLAVNGRAVRDAGLVRAAETAYRSTISAGLRPSLFLDVVVPVDAVDVNVHPAKAEVRFRDRWPVERAVEAAVRRALGTLASAAEVSARVWHFAAAAPAAPAAPVGLEVLQARDASPGGLFVPDAALPDASPADGRMAGVARPEDGPTDAGRAADEPEVVVPPLIQLRRTYIMFERDEGVVLVDQHSAHERVLYEKFMGVLERGDAPSQRLLFPMTLHLGPAQGDAFDANRELFERLGFEIEGFGGHTLLVSAVPMPHPRFDAERCLRETLDALSGDRAAGTAARHERLAATVACKAAIKAGDALSLGEMRALFVALARTSLPAHDVHGRSTIVQLGWDEVDRRFGRR